MLIILSGAAAPGPLSDGKTIMKRPGGARPSGGLTQTLRPSRARDPRQHESSQGKEGGRLAALGLESGGVGVKVGNDPRIAAFERELARRREQREEQEELARELALQQGTVGTPQMTALEEELAVRRASEAALAEELATLRSLLEQRQQEQSGVPDPGDDPYVAELEAQVAALRFECTAMTENYVEMKKLLDLTQDKAALLEETQERARRMEAFLEELQEERNGMAAQLEVANEQISHLANLVAKSEATASDAKAIEAAQDAARAPLLQEIAQLKNQVAQRDGELARQGGVLKELRMAVEGRVAAASSSSLPAAAVPSAVAESRSVQVAESRIRVSGVQCQQVAPLALDASFEVVPWRKDLSDVFVSMVKRAMEAAGERISLQDKKVFRDVDANLVQDGGHVLFLKGAGPESEILACVGLVAGVGTHDMKYVAFSNEALRDNVSLLAQLALHLSIWARQQGSDMLVALWSGSRSDAEAYWGRVGFKFVGVGPAPNFAVRMALDLTK